MLKNQLDSLARPQSQSAVGLTYQTINPLFRLNFLDTLRRGRWSTRAVVQIDADFLTYETNILRVIGIKFRIPDRSKRKLRIGRHGSRILGIHLSPSNTVPWKVYIENTIR
jgi:hypothetical protein